MFRGRFEHTIDSKGRTSLPAKFRETLCDTADGKFVLTTSLEPCLVAYPLEEWTRFEERLAALPQMDPSVVMLRRIYVSGAIECEIDKVGRVVVPQSLRTHAGLKREVVWAGMGRHVEMWSKKRFESLVEAVLEDEKAKRDMAHRLAELGL